MRRLGAMVRMAGSDWPERAASATSNAAREGRASAPRDSRVRDRQSSPGSARAGVQADSVRPSAAAAPSNDGAIGDAAGARVERAARLMAPGRSRRQWMCSAAAIALVVLLLASVARLYHPLYGFTETIGFCRRRRRRAAGPADAAARTPSAVGQLRRAVLRATGARPAAARSGHRSRARPAGLSRPAHPLQLDRVGTRPGPAALDSAGLRAAERALLAAPRRGDDALAAARYAARPGLVGRVPLRSWRARVGPTRAARCPEHVAHRARHRGFRARTTVRLGCDTRRLRPRTRNEPPGRLGAATATRTLGAWQSSPSHSLSSHCRYCCGTTICARSIARRAQQDQPPLTLPGVSYIKVFAELVSQVAGGHPTLLEALKLGVVVSVMAADRSISSIRRDYASPWWRVALPYALLMLTVNEVVWDGFPGAVTRVTLPLVFRLSTFSWPANRAAVLAVVRPWQPASAAGGDASALPSGLTAVC